MMKINNTVKKVIVWRILSFTICAILAYPFFNSFVTSLWVTLYLNVVMTIVHYFFEKFWHRNEDFM